MAVSIFTSVRLRQSAKYRFSDSATLMSSGTMYLCLVHVGNGGGDET